MGSCGEFGWYLMLFLVSPVILQGVGLFDTDWVTATSCEELDDKPACCNSNRSSNYSICDGPFGLFDLHGGVYIMMWIAFVILFTPFACVLYDMCCIGDDDSYEASANAYLGGFCFLFYPIAGMLIFIGCMIIVDAYSAQSFGGSFILCLTSGLYVLILTTILIILLYIKMKRKMGSIIQRDENNEAATQYGGVAQSTTSEVRGVVHDPQTGGFIAFARKINVYHELRHWP